MNITIILPAVQVVKRELSTSPQPTTTPFPPVSVTPSTSGSVTSDYQEILEEYHHHETTHHHHPQQKHLSQSRIDHIAARQAAYDEEFEQSLLRREQAFSPAKSIPIELEEEEELQIISSRISSGHFTTESTSSPETVRTAVIRSPPKQTATRDDGQEQFLRREQKDTRTTEGTSSLPSSFVEKSLHETDHETEIVNQGEESLEKVGENYDQNPPSQLEEDADVTLDGKDGSEKADVRTGTMSQQDILDELEELIIIKEEEGRDGKPHIVITTQGPDHIAELDDEYDDLAERKAVNKFNTGDDREENEGEIETHSSTTALPDSQDKADKEHDMESDSTAHQQVRKSSISHDDHAPSTTSRPVLRRQSRQIFDPDVIPQQPSPPSVREKSDDTSSTRRASTHSDDDETKYHQTNENKRQSISKQSDDFTPYSDTESNESNNTVIAASTRRKSEEAGTASPQNRSPDEQKTKKTTEKRHSIKKQSSDGNNNYTTTTPSPPSSRKGSDTGVSEKVRLSQSLKRDSIIDNDNQQNSLPSSRRGSDNVEKREELPHAEMVRRKSIQKQDSTAGSHSEKNEKVNFSEDGRHHHQASPPHGEEFRRGRSLEGNNQEEEEIVRENVEKIREGAKRGSITGPQVYDETTSSRRASKASPPNGEEFRRGRSLEENKQDEEDEETVRKNVEKVSEGTPRGSITGHPVEKVYDEATLSRRASKAEPAGHHSIQKRGSSDSDYENVQKRALGELSGERYGQTGGSSHTSEEKVSPEKKTSSKGQPVVVRRASVMTDSSPTKQVNYSPDKQPRSRQSPPAKQHSPEKQGQSRDDHQQEKQTEHSQTSHKRSNNSPPKRQSSQQRSPPRSKHSPENKVQHGSQKSIENQSQQKSHQSKQHNSPENQTRSTQSKHSSPENQTRSTQQLPPEESSRQSPPETQIQTRSQQSPPKRAHQSPPAKHSPESSHKSPQDHQKIQTRSSQSPPAVSDSRNEHIQARAHQSPPTHAHQSPPKHTHQSPPTHAHQSPPKHTHQSPPTQTHQSSSTPAYQSPPSKISPEKQIQTRSGHSPPTISDSPNEQPQVRSHQSPPFHAHQSPPTHTHQSPTSQISPEKHIQTRSLPSPPPAEQSHDIKPHNPPQDKQHSPESHQQHGSSQSQPPPTPQHHSSQTQHQPSSDNFPPEKKQEIHASPPATRSYDGIQHQAHQSPPGKQHSTSEPQNQSQQLPPIVTHSSSESQTPPQLFQSPPTKESAGSQTTTTHHHTSPPTIKPPLQPTTTTTSNNNNLGQKHGENSTPKVRTATTTTTHHPSFNKLPPEPQPHHQRSSFKQPTYPHRMTKTTIARQALAREKRRAYVEERIQSYMRKSQYASATALHESYIMNKIRNGGLLPDMDAAQYGADDLTAMREKAQGRRFTKLDPTSMQSLPDINSYHHYTNTYATSSSRRVPFSYHTEPLPPPPPQTLTAISIIKPPPQYYSPIDTSTPNNNNNNENYLPDPTSTTTRSNTTSFQSSAETSQNSGIYIDSNPESTSNFWKNVSEHGFYYSFRVRQSGTVQMMDKSVQTGEQPQSYVLDFSRRPDGRYVLQNSRPVNLGSNSNHHHHHTNNNHDTTTTHLPPINNRK